MNRLEKITNLKRQSATNAALSYLQQKKTNADDKAIMNSQRNQMHTMREILRSPIDLKTLATERVLGTDESKDFPPNDSARAFGVPVARVYEIGASSNAMGFGSCFLVAPNIIITNNHVFPALNDAKGCAANFSHERDPQTKKIADGISFALKPEVFFYTCSELDFTLCSVSESDLTQINNLASLNYLKLIGTKGKVKVGSPINIVQYPGGAIKKYTTEQNLVTEIDDQKGYIYYTTDTLQGSSGSPCGNIFWEVSAIHFTSVPRINSKGEWLTKDNEIFDQENMDDDDVDWIANAGISISKIIDHLSTNPFSKEQQPYINKILGLSIDPLEKRSVPNSIILNNNNQSKTAMENPITMNFNGPTTVYINTPVSETAPETQVKQTKELALGLEKKENFDEDYNTREGYDKNFIEGFTVPLPKVIGSRSSELFEKFEAKSPYIIPYHHYSLVMNKDRRMCMWTASNANYDKSTRDKRDRTTLGNGAWRYDPRVPEKYQISASEFYDPATLVDKGHIVRRDDNCWWFPKSNGESDSLGIEYGNADTFHWTNCTPQHEAFNRDTMQYSGVGLWGVLENAIQSQLNKTNDPNKDYGQRACVLAGPILKNDDPEYNDIQYPLAFWKVFAIKSESEGNLVYGFILSQKDKVEEMGLEKEALPRWTAQVKAMQKSLKDIEEASGVIFDDSLHAVDVLRGKDNDKPFAGSLIK